MSSSSSGAFMLKSELILQNEHGGRVSEVKGQDMLNAIIESSLNNRFFVLMAHAAGRRRWASTRRSNLPIDAVPDLTNVQVQVITEAPALSPLEVESLLSFPVEGAMSGLPNVEQIRSISKFGDLGGDDRLQGRDRHLPGRGSWSASGCRARPRRSRRATARPCSGRSPRPWAKSSSSRSRRPRNRAVSPWSCGRSSTGSSPTSCAAWRASPRSTPTAAR